MIKRIAWVGVAGLLLGGCSSFGNADNDNGFIPLFNGRNLEGWRVAENPDAFQVQDGVLIVDGTRAHLFYAGPVEDHHFNNFHLHAEVLTKPKANSGIYFHTEFQEQSWPVTGYEAQVNNSHPDPRKTGSLYAVQDVSASPVGDNAWFDYDIIVQDKRVIIKINGQTTVDWTEPPDWTPEANMPKRYLRGGTFAIQSHDPESVIHYRNIRVKPLP